MQTTSADFIYGTGKPSLLAIINTATPKPSGIGSELALLDTNKIAVTVSSHTDSARSQNFNYRFIYDPATRGVVRPR